MSVVLALVVVVVVVVVVGAAGAGVASPSGRGWHAGRTAEPGWARRALMIVGLCVLAVSLPLPFARNEGGCLDHCYDAHGWYVWNPAHNLGAPLLALGVVGAATRLRAGSVHGCAVGAAMACGWVGVVYTCLVAPAMVDEFLYGGPSPQTLATRWVAPTGWLLLWAGAIHTGPRAPNPAT